ncbi:hypothetical protein PISMIDRAFT_680397, partial [Pisolithus microcarpus 441]
GWLCIYIYTCARAAGLIKIKLRRRRLETTLSSFAAQNPTSRHSILTFHYKIFRGDPSEGESG